MSSVSPGVNTIKRGEMVSSMGGLVTPSGTLRHTGHTCPALGSSVQLHDIQCIPYSGGGYGPDLRRVNTAVIISKM